MNYTQKAKAWLKNLDEIPKNDTEYHVLAFAEMLDQLPVGMATTHDPNYKPAEQECCEKCKSPKSIERILAANPYIQNPKCQIPDCQCHTPKLQEQGERVEVRYGQEHNFPATPVVDELSLPHGAVWAEFGDESVMHSMFNKINELVRIVNRLSK